MAIDWQFIGSLEGQSILEGYVPSYSASGVTIATGVDIGQRSVDEINRLSIPPGLKARLAPYAMLRGRQAVDVLAAHPLTITPAESAALDAAVREPIVTAFAKEDHAAVQRNGKGGELFGQLCDPRQTVLASVAFQYGPHCRVRLPDFWSLAVAQDWPGLIALLRDFGDDYETRRNKEANYLVQHPCGGSVR